MGLTFQARGLGGLFSRTNLDHAGTFEITQEAINVAAKMAMASRLT